ncbi:MAG: HU family DNA-binding protein [Bacteroidaceae bacterium]|nr:HU family DNA-binding protein [Bacteroidaceae bacterium]
MDAKLNHSDFSALLAKQCNISATKADNFTKAFFDILVEGLESDGIVKINGLGTFKMVDVASRGSVNVNTGEKIEIKGHRKLTFLPADTLKDNVNQPFAMFEPVEVDDDYTDDVTEEITSEESLAPATEAPEETPAPATEAPEETPAPAAEAPEETPAPATEAAEETPAPVAEAPEETPAPATETAEETPAPATEDTEESPAPVAEAPEETPAPVAEDTEESPAPATEAAEETPATAEKMAVAKETPAAETKKSSVKTILYTLFIIIVLSLVLFVILRGNKSDKEEPARPLVAEKIVQQQAPQPDTIAVAAPPSETIKEFILVEQMSALPLSQITIKDTAIYRTAGTMTQHRIGLDETLTKISLKYFNDKRLWPYIVHYNNIKDYNKLEIGTELKIPHLVPRN